MADTLALNGPSVFELLKSRVRWNLPQEELVKEALSNGEGQLTKDSALSVRTGKYTGRSPKDKYTIKRAPSDEHVDWSSSFNQSLDADKGEALIRRFVDNAQTISKLYGFRGYVGRGRHRLPVAVINEYAWHNLMARHMFVRATDEELQDHNPEFTLLYTPSMSADPSVDGTGSETVILCDIENRLGVIGGTQYGGEEKKFFFYLMNYLLPLKKSFPMHCSANVGTSGDVSVIFGLSGTGKTTLSADPNRKLLGDDEHGWDEDGVFNFEGGCYAKMIRLKRESEPLIWDAVNRPHSIMENVPLVEGTPDFEDNTVENTRGVYPLDVVPNIEPSSMAGHPNTLVFLTFDATGTLPPISILDENQALYWFLAGYTAKVAGTERGLGSDPVPTFSACFGAPFLPWHPAKYVDLMRDYLRTHNPTVVLMNTGSIGGPYGKGGDRPPIQASRAMLAAVQSGALSSVETKVHPEYGVRIPVSCPNVEESLLDPRASWAGGEEAYRQEVGKLIGAFHEKVNKVYQGTVDQAVLDAGPKAV